MPTRTVRLKAVGSAFPFTDRPPHVAATHAARGAGAAPHRERCGQSLLAHSAGDAPPNANPSAQGGATTSTEDRTMPRLREAGVQLIGWAIVPTLAACFYVLSEIGKRR